MAKQKFTMPDGEIVERDHPIWKTPYNHDTNFESDRTAWYSAEPGLTKQEFKEETDINTILNRFMKNGEPPPIVLPEHFADLSGRTTYYDMASRISEANALFYELPASKRAVFQNDPNQWAEEVVKATEAGDLVAMEFLGLEVPKEKPQQAIPADPPQADTPAPGSRQDPPGALKTGDTPKPPSETPK